MEQRIWNFLISQGFNAFAVAGIMGNLHAESGLRPNNVEDSSGQADSAYTQKVDNGSYTNFINDRIGYGIAQWTDPSRKKKLYDFIKEQGKSIADLDSQLEFLMYELKTDFKSLYAFLLTAKSVKEASDEVLIKFENPKDKSDNIKRKRATQGFIYYNKYSKSTNMEVQTVVILKKGSTGPEVEQLQNDLIALGYDCGNGGADGDFGNLTLGAVIQFQSDFGLEPDGEVGPMTFNKIKECKNNSSYKKPVSSLNRTASALIAIATKEIGYKEKKSNANLDDKAANAGSGNYTKYARDLAAKGYYNGSKQGYAWCDVWADWCFLQLCNGNSALAQAMQCQTGPLGAGCQYSAGYYKQQNRWSSSPIVGAQVFFYVDGAINHTGLVSAVKGSTITTIEGNSSDQVVTRTYNISDPSIAGYGLPKYDEEPVQKEEIVEEEQDAFTPYKVKITAKKLNIRKKPDKWAEIIGLAKQGDIKEIIAEENSFGKLGGEEGWIMLAYTKL